MNSEKIVNDIFPELPFFARLHREVMVRNYLAKNYLPLLGLILSVVLWVI